MPLKRVAGPTIVAVRRGYELDFLLLDGRGSVIYDRDGCEDFLTLQNIPGPPGSKDTP